jgi:hypothetical protein
MEEDYENDFKKCNCMSAVRSVAEAHSKASVVPVDTSCATVTLVATTMPASSSVEVFYTATGIETGGTEILEPGDKEGDGPLHSQI